MTSRESNPVDVPPWAAGTQDRMHELDPELSEEQIEIVRSYGEERRFPDGEWLWQAGDRDNGFFLVLEGHVDIINTRCEDFYTIISHGRGHYGGEISTMMARGALVAGRANGDCSVIWLSPGRLREMIALESELGEVVLLSFILRRMRMIAEVQGNISLYGIAEEQETGRLRNFLSRHGVPFRFCDVGDESIANALTKFSAKVEDRPVVVTDGKALKNPTIRELAEQIGIAADVDSEKVYDMVVIGGGPAGLAAAVYGASEGLNVLVLESIAPGGQAATSSRIENFFGFPTGISGQGLTGRGFLQAHKFGAEIASARCLEDFQVGKPHQLTLDGGDIVKARTVVIASGAIYREPPIEDLDKFTGGGVHYGASFIEAQLCQQKDVAVVGGGNSAGQAAIFLAKTSRCVRILIRGASLASSMSSYLIDRIERTSNIEVVPYTEVAAACGEKKLERLLLKNNQTGVEQRLETTQLFIFIGAVPATGFVPREVVLDEKGFVKTGIEICADELKKSGWTLERGPAHLETSVQGVYAVGDVRSGSVKRVASAVGEGSVSVQFVHQVIEELES